MEIGIPNFEILAGRTWPCSFRWNLAYADGYAEMLWEDNIIRSLKNTAEE
jgi:hypothetical protein